MGRPAAVDPVPVEIRVRTTRDLEDELPRGLCWDKTTSPDTEDWFPVGVFTDVDAQQLCAGCPVIRQCLEVALRVRQGASGVWGGTTPETRRGIRAHRERRLAAEVERALEAGAGMRVAS